MRGIEAIHKGKLWPIANAQPVALFALHPSSRRDAAVGATSYFRDSCCTPSPAAADPPSGGRQLLAAVDSVGNVVLCLMGQGPEQGAAQGCSGGAGSGEGAAAPGKAPEGGSGGGCSGEGKGDGAGKEAGIMVMRLDAPNRG